MPELHELAAARKAATDARQDAVVAAAKIDAINAQLTQAVDQLSELNVTADTAADAAAALRAEADDLITQATTLLEKTP